ncbi:ABC transporter permease [Glycomyces buryatensis]|uniref:ABC transporter permease n=1 Tax=Glycomyces buryatensis TaxID=2570927 RepID=UPI0014562A55|nr:ABC-2 family transporter protein [Glycomyces buryatensis]
MKRTSSTYTRLIAAQFRAITEYPADFWTMSAVVVIQQIVQVSFIAVVFANVSSIGGWGFHEMLMLIGFMVLADALTEIGWDGIWQVASEIVSGQLDYLMTRPAPVMMQVGASAIGMQAGANLTTGSIMLVVGWTGAGISPAYIPAAVLLYLCAVVVQLTIISMLCCASFWLKGPTVVFAFLGAQVQENVTRFPLNIYPKLVRNTMIWVIPFAFVNFIPVQILTGELPLSWLAIPPLVAAALFGLTVLVARSGLKRYESAGH